MKQHYQGLGHIAIYTEDMEKSLAFYEKIGGEVLKRFTAAGLSFAYPTTSVFLEKNG